MTPTSERPLLVIAGPTASGKSGLALRIAEEMGAEIVSADSQAVYRYFDIGTAKPTPAELGRVRHHLVSVVDPDEPFDAARFQAMADRAIADARSRGRSVVVTGGTGLYLRVLLHGLSKVPGADPAIRRRLTEEASRLGLQAMHARLERVDPATAATVPPTNRVRVLRALEIYEQTGRPASELRAAHNFAERRYEHGLFVLTPPRDALYRDIDRRTRAMFEAGLVDEVHSLVARGFRDTAPMRSVGYAEALAVVEGRATLKEAIEQAARKTRQYAKRQLTWFKKEPGAQPVSPPYDAVLEWARAHL